MNGIDFGPHAEAARRVAEHADADGRGGADEQVGTGSTRLDRVATRPRGRAGPPGGLSRSTERRPAQGRRRTEQARTADTL